MDVFLPLAHQTTEAENFDRSSIGLVGVQEDLVRAVVAVNPNTVVGAAGFSQGGGCE